MPSYIGVGGGWRVLRGIRHELFHTAAVASRRFSYQLMEFYTTDPGSRR